MLSAAATAETANGWGSTTTANSGNAPNISPSPELATVNPTQSRAKGRLRRCFAFLAMRISGGIYRRVSPELGKPLLAGPPLLLTRLRTRRRRGPYE